MIVHDCGTAVGIKFEDIATLTILIVHDVNIQDTPDFTLNACHLIRLQPSVV